MNDTQIKGRLRSREVDGITIDTKPDGGRKMRKHKLIFRITKDEAENTLSLCDEIRGIMLMIPLKAVEDMF